MNANDVTAVLVTRGDHDLTRILDSLIFGGLVIWNNAAPRVQDLGAFGRYEALKEVQTEYVYTQDDDCVVSPEIQQALLDEFDRTFQPWLSNMNPNHNVGMPLLALPGWGAMFEPREALKSSARWQRAHPDDFGTDDFNRVGCDIVIPVLTRSRMIHLGHENLPHAWDPNRTHVQDGYQKKKHWYYWKAAQIRDKLDREAA